MADLEFPGGTVPMPEFAEPVAGMRPADAVPDVEPMTYAELVRRGIIRHRDAQEVEQESYERALATVRKYGP